MTYDKKCVMMKEHIKHAFNNQLFDYEDEDGNPIYRPCTKKEAEEYILSAFDDAVYQALNAMHSGRALEYILKQHGHGDVNIREYQEAVKATDMKREYHFEGETALEKSRFSVINGGKD